MSKQIRGRVKQTPLDLEYKKQIEKIVHSKNKPTKGIEPVHPPEQDLKDDSWNSYFWHYGPQIGAAVSLLLLASYISVSALKDIIPEISDQTIIDAHELAQNIPLPDIIPQVLIDAASSFNEIPNVSQLISEPNLEQYILDVSSTISEPIIEGKGKRLKLKNRCVK